MNERPFLISLSILIFYVVVGLMLTILITGAGLLFTGADLTSLEESSGAISQNMTVAKWLQFASSFALFALPAVLFALDKRNGISLKLNKSIRPSPVFLAVLVMTFTFPLVAALTEINNFSFPESLTWLEDIFRNMEMDTTETMRELLVMNSPLGLLFNLLVVAVAPAIGEELLFRAGFQQVFQKAMNPHLAILLSAFIFSAVHMQFYGLFPRWTLGIVLGYLFYWSGNLWYPIIAHFFNNGLLVILIYFGALDLSAVESLDSTQEVGPWALIFGTMLMIGFLYLYKNSFDTPQIEEQSG